MIRVLIIDDHSAIRTGLEAALKHSPDVVPVGAGSDELELWPLFKRTAPDLVLLDYHLPGQDGLILCHRLKNTTLPPRVIIYSGYADASLAVVATLAGADGVVNKNAPARELIEAIRCVAAGEPVLAPLPADAIAGAAAKLEVTDQPLFAMLLDHCTTGEVADALHIPLDEAATRVRRIIGRLRVQVPTSVR